MNKQEMCHRACRLEEAVSTWAHRAGRSVDCFFKGHELVIVRLFPTSDKLRFCKRCGMANPNMDGGVANWVKRRKRQAKRGARRLVAIFKPAELGESVPAGSHNWLKSWRGDE